MFGVSVGTAEVMFTLTMWGTRSTPGAELEANHHLFLQGYASVQSRVHPGRYRVGLEVAPRSPKRDTRVMYIRGPIEQFSDLSKDTLQQGEFQ